MTEIDFGASHYLTVRMEGDVIEHHHDDDWPGAPGIHVMECEICDELVDLDDLIPFRQTNNSWIMACRWCSDRGPKLQAIPEEEERTWSEEE